MGRVGGKENPHRFPSTAATAPHRWRRRRRRRRRRSRYRYLRKDSRVANASAEPSAVARCGVELHHVGQSVPQNSVRFSVAVGPCVIRDALLAPAQSIDRFSSRGEDIGGGGEGNGVELTIRGLLYTARVGQLLAVSHDSVHVGGRVGSGRRNIIITVIILPLLRCCRCRCRLALPLLFPLHYLSAAGPAHKCIETAELRVTPCEDKRRQRRIASAAVRVTAVCCCCRGTAAAIAGGLLIRKRS